LTKDNLFIDNIRVLENLIHDFSGCDDVTIGLEEIKQVALLANIESNFTQNLVEIIIPRDMKDQQSNQRIKTLSQAIKSQDWTVMIVESYADALAKIRVTC
jgi:hypothetical protein